MGDRLAIGTVVTVKGVNGNKIVVEEDNAIGKLIGVHTVNRQDLKSLPVKQIIKSSSGSSEQLRASAQNVAEKVRSTEAGAEHAVVPVKLAPIEFTGVSMLKAKKSLSQNYEIRNIEYNPDNHVYGFKKIK